MDWQPTSYQLDRAAQMTEDLRTSTKAQWRDARERLAAAGVAPEDAVLADWRAEGQHTMWGTIATRDMRLFAFGVTYHYSESGEPLEEGVGWIQGWREVPAENPRLTPAGYTNSRSQTLIITQSILGREFKGG